MLESEARQKKTVRVNTLVYSMLFETSHAVITATSRQIWVCIFESRYDMARACVCSFAHAFYAASLLTGVGLEKVHRFIEDAVAQADEVDEKYLQVSVLFVHWCTPYSC